MSADEAERALVHAIADVERGTWRPPEVDEVPQPEGAPTFGEFGLEWWTLSKDHLAASTQSDYWWRLTVHLAPYFNELRLDAITFAAIERYIAGKRAGAVYDKGKEIGNGEPLSPRSINMTLTLLGAILERAVKRKLIDHNPARDRDLRVRERAPARSYLDGAGQITALLDAAGELDRSAPKDRRHIERRAMIAVLVFAGLRIGELCSLRWRDVDLAGGWLAVGQAKTDAGLRKVRIRGALRDELLVLRGRHQAAAQASYVFATRSGARMSPDNFRSRVLGRPASVKDGKEKPGTGALGQANARLEAEGLPPLPRSITPHSLRRTFCSLLYALGEDPGIVMDEMGHTDPELALRVYRQAMRRGEQEKEQLQALVEGGAVDAARPEAVEQT